MKVSILELSAKGDALVFERACRNRGHRIVSRVVERKPAIARVGELFATSPHWCFFSGHLYAEDLELMNDPELGHGDEPTLSIRFGPAGIMIRAGDQVDFRGKSAKRFRMHENCRMTLWAGCNALTKPEFGARIHELFGPHLLLGFRQTVRVGVNKKMVRKTFRGDAELTEDTLLKRWLKAAKQLGVEAGALDAEGKLHMA